MTMPGGVNPADVLFKLANNRGLGKPTFEQVFFMVVVSLEALGKGLLTP